MALCDLVGKALRTPAYNLFGGKFRDGAHVYLDRSSPDDVRDLDAWRKLAASSLEGGFTHLKFDVDFTAPECTRDPWNRSLSSAQIQRIVERVAAVRDTVGVDVELCVDCHWQYNVPDAIRLANALAPLNLAWIEDPVPSSNVDAYAAVREKCPIPICVGEMFNAEQFQLFIDHGACDMIHPDVLFCGGLHEARRIADHAELHYLPMAMHGNGGSLATIAAAHVAVSSRNFLGLEYHFIEAEWVGEFVRREGVSLFQDGEVPLTDAPGLGVELDEELCRRYLAPGESLF
jgi:galactonate dehydratase